LISNCIERWVRSHQTRTQDTQDILAAAFVVAFVGGIVHPKRHALLYHILDGLVNAYLPSGPTSGFGSPVHVLCAYLSARDRPPARSWQRLEHRDRGLRVRHRRAEGVPEELSERDCERRHAPCGRVERVEVVPKPAEPDPIDWRGLLSADTHRLLFARHALV
jgi:hypothetical protein